MIVYLLTNQVNGKSYVGQHHGHDLTKRWKSGRYNSYLTAAIKKYGPESFEKRILSYASCQEELDLLEQFWIQTFQTCNRKFGYNIQKGGLEWRGRHTKATKRHISEAMKELWQKKTARQKKQFSNVVRRTMRLVWARKTEAERVSFGQRISRILSGRKTGWTWNKGMIPGPNKGLNRRKKSKEHRRKISLGLKRYYSFTGGRNACCL
jgi:group I intron endonuclease